MLLKKMKWMIIVICYATGITVYATSIESKWSISFGQSTDKIQLIDDLVLYDFEVYNGSLLLCDIAQNKIKRFNSKGINCETISLPAAPEIIKIRDSSLVILLTSSQLGIYDFSKKKLSTLDLKIDIKSFQYSQAFFIDSLLVIPKSDKFISIKSDAYLIDISKLPQLQVITVKDVYDIDREITLPEEVLKIGKNNTAYKMGFCYCSKDVSIIDKYDRNNPQNPNVEYLFYERNTNRVVNLGSIMENKFGMVLHTGICRGFKVYKDGIYFIGLKYEKHKEKRLIISKTPFPDLN